jgi:predicted AlkP superfamily phosphohydrolase/phosphomutase
MDYRVWVIGLDGATFDLIRPWAERGDLPTFSRLMAEGAWGEVTSTIPPITGPAWSSFITGTNPGKHGVFDWVYRRAGTYDFHSVSADNLRQPSLWRIASHAGKRVLALNVPMTYPPEEVNGAIVSGLPATTLHTTPVSLAQEITEQIPGYIVYPDPGTAYSDQGIELFLEQLEKAIQGRIALWENMTGREKWDLAMVVFNATDVVQHALWKFMDSKHPQHNPRQAARYQDAILDIYKKMDNFLAGVMEQMDEQTVLLIMSDHGAGPIHHFIHVNTWLMQERYLRLRKNAATKIKSWLFRAGLSPMPVYDALVRTGLGRLKREVVRGKGHGLMRLFFISFGDVDWANTRAYSLGNIGQIRINLRGREPQGCVEPGEDYEKLVDEIIQHLSDLRDPQTNELVIEKIYRRAQVYQGEATWDGADILFLPRRLEYFGFGEYEFGDHRIIAPLKRGISGTHRMNGIGIAWGKPIQATQLDHAGLADLAPTILHLMGLAVPAHMDGRPLMEILDPDASPPVYEVSPAWEATASTPTGLQQDEEDVLRQRLRDLGYVA